MKKTLIKSPSLLAMYIFRACFWNDNNHSSIGLARFIHCEWNTLPFFWFFKQKQCCYVNWICCRGAGHKIGDPWHEKMARLFIFFLLRKMQNNYFIQSTMNWKYGQYIPIGIYIEFRTVLKICEWNIAFRFPL